MTINLTHKIIFTIFILLGFYLCKIGGYGSDEDTLPMIGTFIGYLNGNFMTSRFTGYPVSEFIIGFLAYNFGSFSTNFLLEESTKIAEIEYYFNAWHKAESNAEPK